MNEVKRYDYGYADDGNGGRHLGLIPRQSGTLVRATDYYALRAENERLREEIERRFTVDEHERLVAKGQEINRNFIGSLSAELAALKAVPDAVDEREAFEAEFPMPEHCMRCGEGYAVTEYGAWSANDYIQKWAGWKARAALSAPAAGQDVSALVEALEKIVAIELQEFGADWEEIEEAQQIASDALAAHKAGGDE